MRFHKSEYNPPRRNTREPPERYKKLADHHDLAYANLITEAKTEQAEKQEQQVLPAAEDDKPPAASLPSFDSEAELEKTDKVKLRIPSEVVGVTILVGESGKLYLISDRARIVPKFTQIGGFGTGRRTGYYTTYISGRFPSSYLLLAKYTFYPGP